MRRWNLKVGDPLCLTLAADAQFTPIDYTNDHIWEINLGTGAPPAIAIETTFGLRARSFRIFPRFGEGDVIITDPEEFVSPPIVTAIYPSFLELNCVPFPDIDVEYEIWVPGSHTLTGRFQITNRSKIRRLIRLDLIGQLIPTEGQRMASLELQAATVLSGFSASVAPIIVMSGGGHPGTGSFPSLRQELSLEPGVTKEIVWAEAALTSREASFTEAREQVSRNWQAERAHIELFYASQLDVYTGNADWDAAFKLAQKQAWSLIIAPGGELPYPSFAISRQPDNGYSMREDGSDYNYLWNGQSPLDAWFLADYLLPSSPELVEGLVLNFLATQNENGVLDWKPGIGGQRSHILATPLLAALTWRAYEFSRNEEFLREVYPPLFQFIRHWFEPEHDRDKDGIPEWDYPVQLGIDFHPLYTLWETHSKGVDIDTAESPALMAFLYRECQSLINIATEIDHGENRQQLEDWAECLLKAVHNSYQPQKTMYFDVDRDTHISTAYEELGAIYGTGTVQINRAFEHPIRLHIVIEMNQSFPTRPDIFIRGMSASGQPRMEHVTEEQFKYITGKGIYTGDRLYSAIHQVDVQNSDSENYVVISTAGYNSWHISQLLPLWAFMASRSESQSVIEQTILSNDRFMQPFGLPACFPFDDTDLGVMEAGLVWNSLIGEGLVLYGFQEQAALLVTHIMDAIIENLKGEGGFRRSYNSVTGKGTGERNALPGFSPISLFLQSLGVKILTQNCVYLSGTNVYPWPVTIKYRGLTVLRKKEKTTIIFPDGNTVDVTETSPQIIEHTMQLT